jgi:hypothetical protein
MNNKTVGLSAFDTSAIIAHITPIIEGPTSTVASRSYPLVRKTTKRSKSSKFMKASESLAFNDADE